jgi:purine-nucleoside/S-methyl-5'-thioadenosine phosphorylase / adenosine deaminase
VSIISDSEPVPDLEDLAITAFTTTRAVGTFGVHATEPVREVMDRWGALRLELSQFAPRLATATQIHGARVLVHDGSWRGWLRGEDADGHFAPARGTALAVSVADCVPVFIGHPHGAVMMLHSGWRGTAAAILPHALEELRRAGFSVSDARVHFGPAICGSCYEVSGEVYCQLTARDPGKPTPVDLRAILADQARAAGVRRITISDQCTLCGKERFFSHRGGDTGRQVGVIVAHA